MVRSLVIGGNGFLGGPLVDALVERGHDVTVFDRFRSPRNFDTPDATILAGDFFDRSDLAAAVRGQDLVFHFLSTTAPATSENDPSLDLRTNVGQTVELLGLCADAEIERFYFASTGGAIYGDQGLERYRETDPALPRSPYAIGKLTIEHYLRYFRVKRGLDAVSLRISNPYGPGQHPGRRQGLIPIALANIATGDAVVRYGDGSMVRDYLYIDDAIEMIARIVDGDPAHSVYNIGSGVGHTVSEVLDAIARVVGRPLDITPLPVPSTFVETVVLETARYRAEFGVPPTTPLERGIASTWEQLERR
ncbi:NAD-dependent epimerase/dehydratase family protein [Plantibacter sp. M259]|uniref:NAD-dependent epimerase/dehydratase family protein n=1 Tax=Plantibacter sp. M259 TaxID=2583822 RepID=UPI00110FFE4D|nr:NAD-dependent epimerase/dehydratase family protein [Plantibacter sp. M259]